VQALLASQAKPDLYRTIIHPLIPVLNALWLRLYGQASNAVFDFQSSESPIKKS